MVVALVDDLWSDIIRSPHELMQLRCFVEESSSSKVSDLESIALGVNQNVLWLEISVHNTLFVHVVDS